LITSPPPLPGGWWYYGLEHGQHVSLYSYKSLMVIADQLGLNLLSDRKLFHLLTAKKISERAFNAMQNGMFRRLAKPWLARRLRGRSLLASDYEKLAGQPLR
jgi:hypothetical protein